MPGCAGQGSASYDYCILDPNPETPSPTEFVTGAPTEQPTEIAVVLSAEEAPSAAPLLSIVDIKVIFLFFFFFFLGF